MPPRRLLSSRLLCTGLLLLAALLLPAETRAAEAEAAVTPSPRPAQSSERIVVLGTAPVSGLYYPAGGALCRLVNARRAEQGVHCLVEATDGSADNLRRLARGALDFAIIQSDWQYHARAGNLSASLGLIEQGSGEDFTEDLRALFSLQAQPVTLLAGPNSEIGSLADLKGRKVAFGPPKTAARAAAERLVEALEWRLDDFDEVLEMESDEQVEALCAGLVDAILLPTSHPSAQIAAATEGCLARLVPIEGEVVAKLVKENPFLAPATIPGGLYRANKQPVPSYGLRATLVTSADTPDELVRAVVAGVFEQLDGLAAQHPALAGLTPRDMIEAGNSAPLHPAALAYYQERGWK